jgi:hypothetical protein
VAHSLLGSLVKTKRRSISWHSEHMKEWCSKPGTSMVSSGTTFIRIISPPHAIQRIARTPISNRLSSAPHTWQHRHWPRNAVVTRYGFLDRRVADILAIALALFALGILFASSCAISAPTSRGEG